MRVPLELLRIILLHAERLLTIEQLFKLRLVSRTFDNETLAVIFTGKRPSAFPCIINDKTWPDIPASLRKQYLRFKIDAYKSEPTMFPYLFLRVVEVEMKACDLDINDEEAKHEMIEEMLQYVMHHSTNFDWVVTHKLSEFGHWKDRFAWTSENRVDQFVARMSHFILQQDGIAVRKMLQTETIAPNERSTCFGGSVAEFAVRHGTLEMITLLWDHWLEVNINPSRPDNSTYTNTGSMDLIQTAMTRKDDMEAVVQFLMDRYFPPESIKERRVIMKIFLKRVFVRGHLFIAQCIMRKLNDLEPEDRINMTPFRLSQYAIRFGQLPIIEWLFTQADINTVDKASGHGLLNAAIKDWRTRVECIGRVTTLLAKKERAAKRRHTHPENEKMRLQLLADSAVAMIEILIDLGVDVNLSCGHDKSLRDPPSPIFLAAREGLVKGMELLLKKGADPKGRFEGFSILEEAAEGKEKKHAVRLLRKYGWDVDEIRRTKGRIEPTDCKDDVS